jgi:hypothetical protein
MSQMSHCLVNLSLLLKVLWLIWNVEPLRDHTSTRKGSILHLEPTTVVVRGDEQYVIKATSLAKESYGCTVGFVPQFLLHNSNHLPDKSFKLISSMTLTSTSHKGNILNGGVLQSRFL